MHLHLPRTCNHMWGFILHGESSKCFCDFSSASVNGCHHFSPALYGDTDLDWHVLACILYLSIRARYNYPWRFCQITSWNKLSSNQQSWHGPELSFDVTLAEQMTISWSKGTPVVSIVEINSLSDPLFLFCSKLYLKVIFWWRPC